MRSLEHWKAGMLPSPSRKMVKKMKKRVTPQFLMVVVTKK